MENQCLQCFAPLETGGVCPQCGFNNAAYAPKPHHLPPGTVLHGRYIIGRALGEGGFGITYAGYDPVLRRRIAIKEFYPSGAVWREPERSLNVNCLTSGNFTELFRIGRQKCMQEAQSLATLDDIPAIVRILDFFEENNTAYIIMEFVDGVTLREYARRQPKKLTLAEAMTLLAPVTDALEKVHKRGFVHRDVSPDNIMITTDGAARLLDFGAVKHMSSSDGTMTQNPIVKRGFSPLELYSTSGKIGPWTDVYALAATVFFLLTGSQLEEPADRLDHDTTAEKLRGVLPPAQTEAMLHALAIQRGARQQSVRAFFDELTAKPAVRRDDRTALNPKQNAVQNTAPAPKAKTPPKPAPIAVPPKPAPIAAPPKAGSSGNGAKKAVLIAAPLALLVILAVVLGLALGHKPNREEPASQAQNESAEGEKEQETTASRTLKVGDIYTFGSYEQDADENNGKEPIEWQVLAVDGDKALLISKYTLDWKAFDSDKDASWEKSALRKTLNGTFLTDAFTEQEQERIISSAVPAAKSSDKATTDKIFLLSLAEAKQYGVKFRAPTNAVLNKGAAAYANGGESVVMWLLRDPKQYTGFMQSDYSGGLGGVCPAMWITRDSGEDAATETTIEQTTTAKPTTKEDLKANVQDFTNKKILEFVCDDFDGDGAIEAFVLTGKVEDGNLNGELIFTTADKCEVIAKSIDGWYSEDTTALQVETINGRKFLLANFSMGAHGVMFGVFSTFDGKCRQITIYDNEKEYGMEFGHVGKEDNYTIWVGLQSYTSLTFGTDTDGSGLSFQTYYFYWDEAKQTFREYGAIEVSKDELAKVKGAETALKLIEKENYQIAAILFRGNGVTEINAFSPQEESARINYYITLKYDPVTDSFDIIKDDNPEVTDPYFKDGICLKTVTTAADYPKAFPEVKEWYR